MTSASKGRRSNEKKRQNLVHENGKEMNEMRKDNKICVIENTNECVL